MRIAIQGALGSFHHEAALQLEPSAEIVPQQGFADVFRAVLRGDVHYGLCAIENSLHGSINEVYRLLERHDVWIVRDLQMHITQNLIGPQAVELSELAASPDVRVLSQAPALAQVELWLDAHLPNAVREETHDTAATVERVVQLAQPHTLAIAGKLAAGTYGGTVVAADVQDDPHNYTRFILFQKDREAVPSATHASIILKTSHEPGALLHVLQLFDATGINLSKLDSHPIAGDQQHYRFYLDFAARFDAPAVREIFAQLEKQGCEVKVLGCYPRVS